MKYRYKPRFNSDRFLGQYGRFDIWTNRNDRLIIARWGDHFKYDELSMASYEIEQKPNIFARMVRSRNVVFSPKGRAPNDLTSEAFIYGLKLLKAPDDVSISPNASL